MGQSAFISLGCCDVPPLLRNPKGGERVPKIVLPPKFFRVLRAPEREALQRAIEAHPDIDVGEWQRTLDLLYRVLRTRRRFDKKAEANAASDGRRRILVGAGVPREFYERCRREADAWGVSLYAWVVKALERALEKPLE